MGQKRQKKSKKVFATPVKILLTLYKKFDIMESESKMIRTFTIETRKQI